MVQFDDSAQPYNDKFKYSKNIEKVLFKPKKPVFQSELNEMQSMFMKQIQVGNDTVLDEGTVISGMGLIPKGVIDPTQNNYVNNSSYPVSVKGTSNLKQTNPLENYTFKVNSLSELGADIKLSIHYKIKGLITTGTAKNNVGTFTLGFNSAPMALKTIDLAQDPVDDTIELTISQKDLAKGNQTSLICYGYKLAEGIEIEFSNPSILETNLVKGNPNLINYQSLVADNSTIDLSDYAYTGLVSLNSKPNTTQDVAGLGLSFTSDKEGDVAVSFNLTRTSGNLYNFGLNNLNGLEVSSVYVDGKYIVTDTKAPVTTNKYLFDKEGSQVNLTEGNPHLVVIRLGNVPKGSHGLEIQFNKGTNQSAEGSFSAKLNNLKAELGDNVTAWSLSTTDKSSTVSGVRNKLYTIDDGIVYTSGMFRHFDSQQITISATGKEIIGFKLESNPITYRQDVSLLDDTLGTVTNQKEGADRLKYNFKLTYNDPSSTKLYILQDGKIIYSSRQLNALNDVLARRTNDESGSYRVSGYNMWSAGFNKLDSSLIDLVVDSGKGYVQGYEIGNVNTTKVQLKRANATSGTIVDNLHYSTDSTLTMTNQPVQDISQVVGQVHVGGESVSRATVDRDSLVHQDVISIDKISSGGVTYEPDNGITGDYRLSNNQVVWNIHPTSKAPSKGTTFYIDYTYNANFMTNEYDVVKKDNVTSIKFNNSGGRVPIDNSLLQVYYTAFLSREDVIMLDKNGQIHVVEGQPLPLEKVQPVYQQDPLMLRLGYVIVHPNSDIVEFIQDTITRSTELDIQNSSENIEALRKDVSILTMKLASMANQDPQTMVGSFGDDFENDEKADITHKDFKVYYDKDYTGETSITVPNLATDKVSMEIDRSLTGATMTDMDATIPYSTSTWLTQPYATGSININPYSIISTTGEMKINPATDSWTDSSFVERWNPDTHNFTAVQKHGWFDPYSNTVSDVSVDRDVTREYEEEYARPVNINIDIKSLEPNTNGYKFMVDGEVVTGSNGYYLESSSAGSYWDIPTNSFRTDDKGEYHGVLKVSANTLRTGTREIVFKNDNNFASTTYYSRGTKTDREVVRTKHYWTTYTFDPLAQSFFNDTARSVPAVSLYFATKTHDSQRVGANNNQDIRVQLRATNNAGDITGEILANKTLKYDDVKVSNDGSVATRIVFDEPAQLDANTMYAIVVITSSDVYELYYAKAGEKQKDNDVILGRDAYPAGIMFQSSNSYEWTKVQDKDLKFDVEQCDFADNSQVVYKPVYTGSQKYTGTDYNLDFTKLTLYVLQATPGSTSVRWEMKVVYQGDNTSIENHNWQTITPDVPFVPTSAVAAIQFRAILTGRGNLSPDIYLDSVAPVVELTGTDGTYISRDIDMGSYRYNNIDITYEADLPQGTSANVFYSTDKGLTWNPLDKKTAKSNTTKYINYTFSKLLHNTTTGDYATANNVKLRVDMHTDSKLIRPHIRRLISSQSLK